MSGEAALVALPVLPLLGAVVAVLSGRWAVAATAAVAAGVAAALAVLGAAVAAGGPVRVDIGGWAPPLGIALEADGLALAFLALAAVVMAAVAVAARPRFGPGPGRAGKVAEPRAGAAAARPSEAGPGMHAEPGAGPEAETGPETGAETGAETGPQRGRQTGRETRAGHAFWPLVLWLWAAMNLCFVSRDLFNLYVALELLTLAAVALVAIEGRAETLAAALRYMVFALMGSLLYLGGVVLLYAAHATLDIGLLAVRVDPGPPDRVAMGLMTAGLAVKTALFPFHAWLPPAHSGAPAPASALLSALVPKASFFILWRLWFEALPDLAAPLVLALLGGLGAAAVLYGSVLALMQDRLKLIVAYSTVAQVGYLFLVFPLAGGAAAAQPWAAGAWSGAGFHALSHGLAKAAMFLAAGLLMTAAGGDGLARLRGLARAMPMTVFAFGLAAVALTGLPPSGGFTAKYLMMTSDFAAGQPVWAGVLVLGGLLAAAYLYRPMAHLFAQPRPEGAALVPVSRAAQAVPLALALLAILLGVASAPVHALMQIGRPEAAVEGL